MNLELRASAWIGAIGSLLIIASMLGVGGAALAAERSAKSKASAHEERKPPVSYHATAFVRGSMGIRVIDYWSKGASMRARTMIGGHPVVTLVHGGRYAAIDLLNGRGVSIRRPPSALAQDETRVRPFAFELDELIADGGEKIEDVLEGPLETEIWQVRDGQGRRKVWVSSVTPRVPLRVETFSRAAAETHQLDYSNWIFDLDLPDDFFTPPQGIRLDVLEYDEYTVKLAAGSVAPIPILYPDLLHGIVKD